MENKQKISHQQLVSFIRDESDNATQKYILNIRENDPVYQLLFELVDQIRTYVTIRSVSSVKVISTFSNVEDILLRIFAGNIQQPEAQQFMDGLLNSPVFYQHLLTKLSTAAPQIAMEGAPEISQVHVKTDEEILNDVFTKAKGVGIDETGTASIITRWSRSVTDVVKGWRQMFDFTKRLPRYAYAIPVVIICVLIFFVTYDKIIKRNMLVNFVYDNKVPYEYDVSSLRSPIADVEGDFQLQSFINEFKLGISDYTVYDYSNAIRRFKNLESSAVTLMRMSEGQEIQAFIRDFYFYWGLCHLALSRKEGLEKEIKEEHANESIKLLSHADSLVLKYRLEGKDREAYFLGLAYGFVGHRDLAVVQFEKINPESDFYEDGLKLIQEWSQ